MNAETGNSERRRAVLVTGGRRGIGRGIALAFAAGGYDVVINDIVNDEALAETRHQAAAFGASLEFVEADIADMGAHPKLVRRAFDAFGGIDVLVNNAGISVRKRGDMLDVSPESFDELMAVNLRGPFFLTQTIARRWLAEGRASRKAIINISSANATMVSLNRAEYCIAKTGVAMMTKLYAARLAEAGIGVFEIRPGIIRTDMTAVAKDRYDGAIADGISPIKRWGEPEDIGAAAVALASGAFQFSTGDAINVDGGLHIQRL
jgi:3-oxoacyl-[acyl-carrier protein] reductase